MILRDAAAARAAGVLPARLARLVVTGAAELRSDGCAGMPARADTIAQTAPRRMPGCGSRACRPRAVFALSGVGGRRAVAERVRIGCSGWNYDSWRDGVFYPPRLPARRWLASYAERFDTVEVNTSFYRLPKRAAVERWAEETPDDFLFAVKVSRYVTHIKRLRDVPEHLPLLLERIEPLIAAHKLGPLLWQLPPTFKRDDERLETALAGLPQGLEHAFEFRHESWFAEPVMAMLRAHGVALVIADRPEIRSFQTHELTADFVFVRFHYGSRGRRGNYSDAEVREWAHVVAAWARERPVYAYFNNDWEGFAPRNAVLLGEAVASEIGRAEGAAPSLR
jgi:uncharacterized protein YecE (DUF72 family)